MTHYVKFLFYFPILMLLPAITIVSAIITCQIWFQIDFDIIMMGNTSRKPQTTVIISERMANETFAKKIK